MSRVENFIAMLLEFDYLKNGKELSIEFLEYLKQQLEDTFQYEWEVKK